MQQAETADTIRSNRASSGKFDKGSGQAHIAYIGSLPIPAFQEPTNAALTAISNIDALCMAIEQATEMGLQSADSPLGLWFVQGQFRQIARLVGIIDCENRRVDALVNGLEDMVLQHRDERSEAA